MDAVEILQAEEGLLTLSLANASERLPAIFAATISSSPSSEAMRWRS